MLSFFEAHDEEVGMDGLKFGVDIEMYQTYEKLGCFIPIFAEDDLGINVGYMMFLLYPHPHYKGTIFATTDCFYIVPSYRGSTLFRDMLQYSEEVLRSRGVDYCQVTFSVQKDISPLAKRYGYKELDKVFYKRL